MDFTNWSWALKDQGPLKAKKAIDTDINEASKKSRVSVQSGPSTFRPLFETWNYGL